MDDIDQSTCPCTRRGVHPREQGRIPNLPSPNLYGNSTQTEGAPSVLLTSCSFRESPLLGYLGIVADAVNVGGWNLEAVVNVLFLGFYFVKKKESGPGQRNLG
ncbi:hypothetical protein KY290_016701 [Solanum tuberosum]|uniref:Uncharacterized protein n=1 Tax=Solanum tuberosum TaxID=4113 RepID=A0ABQ7VBB3_SOLTU|nr:hypothetical protein KY284_015982 [Solanum tuberosum]KAH0760628.1 hypothetical protein KY290_016701 [Solanum tuberosum]